ncbi:MAG: glycosyltransferase family 4 protein [Candidatus Pacebacteria bacterium]|nr:glycosyltransferase family 4 protein [Candidatus Paceibacterota bacterium]
MAPPQTFKICHLITRMIIGGAQENTLLSVKGLRELGHHVVLAGGPTQGPEGNLLHVQAGEPEPYHEFPDLVRQLKPGSDLHAYRALKAYFKAQAFDIVHTHSSKAGILGRMAARSAKCPLIVHTVHGQAFHPYEKWWRNKVYILAERFAARRCDHMFAVAQAMIDQCVTAKIAPRDKYSVVYSGMDMQAFTEARPDPALRAQLGIPEGVPVIGKIARLFEFKGHDHLLQAALGIVEEFPEVRFLLVGDGLLRPQLEAEVRRLGLEKNVVFAGLVPPREIPRYVALMDILAHLSLREGLPRTVVQALAGRVPAVGFALDGTPEVIHDGETGFLCPPKDAGAVENALRTLLRNPELIAQLGKQGQALVRERFDWRAMVKRLDELYRTLWEQKG